MDTWWWCSCWKRKGEYNHEHDDDDDVLHWKTCCVAKIYIILNYFYISLKISLKLWNVAHTTCPKCLNQY